MPSREQQQSGAASSDPVRAPRQSRLLKAALNSDRFGRFDVTIRNVSQTGIGGNGPHILSCGDRVTIDLPGHKPMRGTVRWVVNTRFGIAADQAIRLDDLRSAYGGSLTAVDGSHEFRVIPPPKADMRRPGLKLGSASHPAHGRSEWVSG